jgi:hypothetical protein
MNKQRIFRHALTAGATIEAVLCGLTTMFGRFGPCGPVNDLTGLLLVLHIPGIFVAGFLLRGHTQLELPMIILVSTALWSAAAFVVLSIVRSLVPQASPVSEEKYEHKNGN